MTISKAIKLLACINSDDIAILSDKECPECKYRHSCRDLFSAVREVSVMYNDDGIKKGKE